MYNLAYCWLLIEAFVIPDGFRKWFFLSFYIHPFFLFFCQIFLWLNFIFSLTLNLISFLIITWSFFFKFLKNCVIYVFSSTRLTNVSNHHQSYQTQDQDHVETFVQKNSNTNPIINSYNSTYSCLQVLYLEKCYDIDQVSYEDDLSSMFYGSDSSDDDQYVASSSSSSSSSSSVCSSDSAAIVANSNRDMNECSSFVLISSRSLPENPETGEYFNSLAMVERQEEVNDIIQGQDFDEFYNKYTQRMGWFDVLNYDRTCAILKNEVEGRPINSEKEKMMILRSIEGDLELVYVAQSCLSWEALHHQYLKVEALAQSTCGNGVFYNNLEGEFQKFQVVLERFMEDERCLGKRVHNFVTKRFHLNTFLQVPNISGFYEEEIDEMKKEGTSVEEVMKAIEKCIEAFWLFVKTDENYKKIKKGWLSFWSCPPVPVEDPRDLYLFAQLTTLFRKKEIWLKDVQGKQKCWIRRVECNVEKCEKKDILLTKIDMKLISRVLQLPLISSSQLKWCHQKLEAIHFHQGKIVRPSSSTSSPLFPP